MKYMFSISVRLNPNPPTVQVHISKDRLSLLHLHMSHFPSRFSFPRPPCCALRGPPSSTSPNEHGWSSSPSTTAGASTTFSRGTPASSPTSTSHGWRESRGRAPRPDGSCRYDRWSQTASRPKSETPVNLCGFCVLMNLLQVRQDVTGLSPPNLTDILEKFTICTYQRVRSNFGLLSSPQPEDSSSGAKNDANRTSGGSGGLMEEMNALLARRSEQ